MSARTWPPVWSGQNCRAAEVVTIGRVSRIFVPVEGTAGWLLEIDRGFEEPAVSVQRAKKEASGHGGTAMVRLTPPIRLPAASYSGWLEALGLLAPALHAHLDR